MSGAASEPGLTYVWIMLLLNQVCAFVVSEELVLDVDKIKGHATTVFCKIAVRRSKYCLEFSFASGRLKISR